MKQFIQMPNSFWFSSSKFSAPIKGSPLKAISEIEHKFKTPKEPKEIHYYPRGNFREELGPESDSNGQLSLL